MNPFLDKIAERISQAQNENRFRAFRPLTPHAQSTCTVAGRECVDFSSNDYLGLSDHPHLAEVACAWTRKYGVGSRGSRLVTGTFDAIPQLETRIAQWKHTERALILGSGYMANVGLLRAFAEKGAVFFGDKLNHASLNLGCADAQIIFKRYQHNNLTHLESLLQAFSDAPLKVIVSDTVFSMDGDVAPVDDLRALAEKYHTLLYLDDAHAGGLFGENGKGLAGSVAPWEIAMGTCSKAFGSYGAYVGCSQLLYDYFVNYCGSMIYTTALPPSVYGSIAGALDIFESPEGAKRREHVLALARYFREKVQSLGFETGPSVTPIVPVIIGENDAAVRVSNAVLEAGFLAAAIRSPTVPLHTARLRVSISAAHTQSQVDGLLNALKMVSELN